MKRLLLIGMAILACQCIMGQEISGVITKKGKPKKGITVWLKKTDKAVDTDKDGRFTLRLTYPNDTLQITAAARADAKFAVGDWKEITVELDKKDFIVSDGTKEERFPYTLLPLPKPSDGVTHEMIMRSGLRSVADILRNYMTGVQVSTDGGTTKVLIHGISSSGS